MLDRVDGMRDGAAVDSRMLALDTRAVFAAAAAAAAADDDDRTVGCRRDGVQLHTHNNSTTA